jgi:hypothetical protein
MERLLMNKMDTWFEISDSLKKKGGRVGKQRQLGMGETNTIEKNRELILQISKGSNWFEEKHSGWKIIFMTISIDQED